MRDTSEGEIGRWRIKVKEERRGEELGGAGVNKGRQESVGRKKITECKNRCLAAIKFNYNKQQFSDPKRHQENRSPECQEGVKSQHKQAAKERRSLS